MNHISDDTIIAQCTPQGSGALALIRISGQQAVQITDALAKLASEKKLSQLPTHTIHYGSVVDANGNLVDSVMFLLMRAPRTFTGEDTVEITCHNNPFLIESIIQEAIRHGARLAQPGEFSQRSFLHGKIDLVQAEAINELIHASSQVALKQALSQLEGSFSHWVTAIEKDLVKALALSEASFEFLDDEHSFVEQIKTIVENVQNNISIAQRTFNQQKQIREGVRIAIVGSVNAGKSSLFNTLLNQKRAIVTNIAGTTRDAIEAGVYRNGNYWTLIDTAGLRNTDDIVEKEGIERAFAEAHKADIILMVIDQARIMSEAEETVYQDLLRSYKDKSIVVYNKCDLQERPSTIPSARCTRAGSAQDAWVGEIQSIHVSTKTAKNMEQLEQALETKIATLYKDIASPFLLNKRHYTLLLSLEQKLITIVGMLTDDVAYELLSHHLKDALEHLTELTGKSISEAGMDAVFKEFCVGK